LEVQCELTHWSPIVQGVPLTRPAQTPEIHCPLRQSLPLVQGLPLNSLHVLLIQLNALPHATPQAPQLNLAVLVSVSHPLAGLPSQLAKPALQEAMPQTPPLQPAVPLATAGQTVPQAPQLLVVFRGVQAPPQQPLPAAQTTPQAPQWLLFVCVLISQPSE
jgi:hypothetical protein